MANAQARGSVDSWPPLDLRLSGSSGFGARTIGNSSSSENRIRKNQGLARTPSRSPGVKITTIRNMTRSARMVSSVAYAAVVHLCGPGRVTEHLLHSV